MSLEILPASATHTEAIARILYDWSADTPWMPKLHLRGETAGFCASMIARGWVTIAAHAGAVAGFMSRDEAEIHALYISAKSRSQGHGKALLEHAKAHTRVLTLWTFEANLAARKFYEREGFYSTRRTEGEGNDEHLPDIRYVWRKQEAGHG